MTTLYVPPTGESDHQKQNMSLQLIGGKVSQNIDNIATNTTNIATNTASIAAMQAAWTTYTPTITAQTGTFTTVSAAGAYLPNGKQISFTVTITITTVGTATGAIIMTLPTGTPKRNAVAAVREISATGVAGIASTDSSTMRISKYDNSTLAASGNVIVVTGIYEIT